MHESTKYPKLEKVLYEWFLQYQEKVNMTREMIQTKAKEFLQKLYGDANFEFYFSMGWLEWFKARHEIKFSESGSVIMENIEDALPQIKAKLKNFDWKDIYNMDEIVLFYSLQADHSQATKQLEGQKITRKDLLLWFVAMGMFDPRMTSRKMLLIVNNCLAHSKIYYRRHFYSSILESSEKGEIILKRLMYWMRVAWNINVKPTTIANCFRHCKIRSEEDMPLEQEIGDVEDIHKLKEVISDLHYKNAMDVEQILNYPNPDDSSILPHVSPKEAFLVVDILKNYLIQHEKNIPDLVYALLKVKKKLYLIHMQRRSN
ncbi:hypothetical protein CXB51_025501 [Gossypium anomalum]|uniref:HTH CENPB-type domain-containing protein n=1 Tax=Gossypium anomalum TaxID=47600 RepID=A0A8J6CUX5_9ROSI|nr:hypothetical protein CXB51_025501 [Gossypium anomalum]